MNATRKTKILSGYKNRYARQISMPAIGLKGQKKMRTASILIIGAGGLGSPAAFYLASAGIGTIGLVDNDLVELSNLQRQILHTTADLSRQKTISAAEKLHALNPDITIRKHNQRFSPLNAIQLVKQYDFVIDATDNFQSKFLIADICHETRIPYNHGGVLEFLGQTMTVIPGKTACYRCIFQQPPEEHENAIPRGPLGTVPGVIGTIQAMEAIKYVLNIGNLLTNRLLVYESLSTSFRDVKLTRNRYCPVCGRK
ncbi:MAG: adenylyltransferase [Lentisphaerae bacterium RIFOXYA12_FULL_48_11]|nr:MAG: adenylyltransferase [Lentisphaerae bacterium RIFOXYA12_FULL_48_11]